MQLKLFFLMILSLCEICTTAMMVPTDDIKISSAEAVLFCEDTRSYMIQTWIDNEKSINSFAAAALPLMSTNKTMNEWWNNQSAFFVDMCQKKYAQSRYDTAKLLKYEVIAKNISDNEKTVKEINTLIEERSSLTLKRNKTNLECLFSIQSLVEKADNIDYRKYITQQTALMYAIRHRDDSVIYLLLRKGANHRIARMHFLVETDEDGLYVNRESTEEKLYKERDTNDGSTSWLNCFYYAGEYSEQLEKIIEFVKKENKKKNNL